MAPLEDQGIEEGCEDRSQRPGQVAPRLRRVEIDPVIASWARIQLCRVYPINMANMIAPSQLGVLASKRNERQDRQGRGVAP